MAPGEGFERCETMNIAVIDKNLRMTAIPRETDVVWYNSAQQPFVVYGAWQADPQYLRIPPLVAESVSKEVAELNRHAAGVRIRFRTDSPYIAVRLEWSQLSRMSHMPLSGICGLDLYLMQNDRQIYAGAFIPPVDAEWGFEAILYRPGRMTDYVLNLPLYNRVDKLFIGVGRDASFQQPAAYKSELPVVFYGSSITQGGCASRPGNSYPNFLSRWLNMDYSNLGFSGSARAEEAMAAYLAELPMSVFVSDYDHNAPDADYLAATHLRMYQMIRKNQPLLPYVIISRPDFKESDEEMRQALLKTYQFGLEKQDKRLFFVDGARLFDGVEPDACTVDGCHPNDLGFYRMAVGILPMLQKAMSCEERERRSANED